MEYNEILGIVSNDRHKKFKVTFADGSTKILRMWRSNNGGSIGVLNKGKSKLGHKLEKWCDRFDEWVSLVPVEKSEGDIFKLFKRRVEKARNMLRESGMWANILTELDHFLSLSEDEQKEMCNDIVTDSYNLFFLEIKLGGKYEWVRSYQIFETLAKGKGFKSINYHKNEREHYNTEVANAIKEKTEFSHKWYKGYDNSLDVKLCEDGILRGWYSEEYKGCLNGHYYLLFDATHAVFYEDD